MGVGSRVLVLGGGIAGITAALDCAATGADVTLVEVRRRLGGAAYSFEREGLHMDNGQHVFLRCCHAYRGLLRRLGSDGGVLVQPRLDIPVLKPGSRPVRLRRSSLPAPLHLGVALARYPHLSPAQRLGAARAALRLLRATPPAGSANEAHATEPTLGRWLADNGQDADTVAALWDLIALPTLNLRAEEASLALGLFVFRTGLLSAADAGDIGFHVAALSETIGIPAERALAQAGVRVMLGWRAEQVCHDGSQFEVRGAGQRDDGPDAGVPAGGPDGEPSTAGTDALAADVVVVALPHARAATLLEPLLGELSARLRRLGTSPIVNLHVVFDRRVCDEPFAAGVGTPVQYLFDRTAAGGAPAGSQYLAVSLSGADREMSMSVAELREQYVPALRALLPRARDASIELFLATREHAATFRATPGVQALRPPARTAIAGLVLAGAWTDTGWPATLEGAVLSGHAAAREALRVLGVDPSQREGTRRRASQLKPAGAPAGGGEP